MVLLVVVIIIVIVIVMAAFAFAAESGMMFLVVVVIIIVMMAAFAGVMLLVVVIVIVMAARMMLLMIIVVIVMAALGAQMVVHGCGAGVVVPKERILDRRVAILDGCFDFFSEPLHFAREFLAGGETDIRLLPCRTAGARNPRREDSQGRAPYKENDAGAKQADLKHRCRHELTPSVPEGAFFTPAETRGLADGPACKKILQRPRLPIDAARVGLAAACIPKRPAFVSGRNL